MLPSEQPDRIYAAFDNHRLVANARLILPVTLAHDSELSEQVDCYVDLHGSLGRANVEDKLLTLLSALRRPSMGAEVCHRIVRWQHVA